jgi:hypothetical protein
MPEVPALGRLQQKNHEFEARLDCLARPCLKRKKNKKMKAILVTTSKIFTVIK